MDTNVQWQNHLPDRLWTAAHKASAFGCAVRSFLASDERLGGWLLAPIQQTELERRSWKKDCLNVTC
jgi:hypothetical protein